MAPTTKRTIVERRQRERAARATIAKPLLFALSAGMFLAMLVMGALMMPFVGGLAAAAKRP